MLGADGEWLADTLSLYLREAANGMTLDRAFGVATKPGRRPWWKQEERNRQRKAARALAELCPAPAGTSQAAALHTALSRYQAGRFRFDAGKSGDVLDDPKRRAMHDVLTANSGHAPARRTLERLLCDTSSPSFCRSDRETLAPEVPSHECTD